MSNSESEYILDYSSEDDQKLKKKNKRKEAIQNASNKAKSRKIKGDHEFIPFETDYESDEFSKAPKQTKKKKKDTHISVSSEESDDFSKPPKQTSKKKMDTEIFDKSEDAYIYDSDIFSDKFANARKKKSKKEKVTSDSFDTGVSDSSDYTYSSSELDCDSEDSKSKKKQSSRKEKAEELSFNSSESEFSDASIIICESPTSDDESSSNAQLFPLSDADAKRIH
jgi:hypothetical protein